MSVAAENLSPDAADVLRIVRGTKDLARANVMRRLRIWHESSAEKDVAQEWLGWTGLGRWFRVSRAERGVVLMMLERGDK